jgi:hypothetical protein
MVFEDVFANIYTCFSNNKPLERFIANATNNFVKI